MHLTRLLSPSSPPLAIPRSAIANCGKVLDKEPSNVKALYRRGLSRLKIGILDLAKKVKALVLDYESTSFLRDPLTPARRAYISLKEKKKKALLHFIYSSL